VIDALNVAHEEREKRGFVRMNLGSLNVHLGRVLALLLTESAVVAFPLALDHVGLAPDSRFECGNRKSAAGTPELIVPLLSRSSRPWTAGVYGLRLRPPILPNQH
jgi:uncharacterized BrkB/YihY/UPF0761 family membrane protein